MAWCSFYAASERAKNRVKKARNENWKLINNDMKHPLEHFFTPTGKVVVIFNLIETSLIRLAGGICLPEYKAVTALMAEASFSRKLDALKCIGDEKIKNLTLHAKLTELLKHLQAVEDVRNRISHTLFLGSPESQMWKLKWGAKRKTGNKPILESTSLKEIEQAGEQVNGAFSELCEFTQTLQEHGVLRIQLVQGNGQKKC